MLKNGILLRKIQVKRKYLAFALVGLLITVVLIISMRWKAKPMTEIDMLADAKSKFYGSYEDIEQDADILIRCVKTEKEENKVFYIDGTTAYHGFTISDVEIVDIMKNTSGQDLAIGEKIPILENQFTYFGKNEKITYHINHYSMMIPQKEYFLFLKYSESDGWYYVMSGLMGKLPVDEKEDMVYPVSKITFAEAQPITEEPTEIIEAMKKIREECISRHM